MVIISLYSTFIMHSNSHVIHHNGVMKTSSTTGHWWGEFGCLWISNNSIAAPPIKWNSVLIMSDNNCHVSWTDLLCQGEVLNSLPKSTIPTSEKPLLLDSLCKSPTRFVFTIPVFDAMIDLEMTSRFRKNQVIIWLWRTTKLSNFILQHVLITNPTGLSMMNSFSHQRITLELYLISRWASKHI